ncbi:MAG: LPS export ABC transporter periplasmic protein LptC [Bacteroidetes bacterium]|nr:MAG: LPS export ABC transporter periplasmic protein LptC [Bacteroidota bacterium]
MKINNIFMKAAILVIAAFFMSCGNDEASIEEQSNLNDQRDSATVEVARDVVITYTDSGLLRAKISAPLMKRFPDKDNPRLEMPNGVKADFFDSDGEIQSSLTAKYAMHYEKDDRIEIRDSVRVINKNDEEIKTDELIWDKKNRRVTSDKPVRVRIRNEKIIKAEGFESDESFMNYTFKKVTGVVYLNEEIGSEETEPIR